jgi:hypothetical protein
MKYLFVINIGVLYGTKLGNKPSELVLYDLCNCLMVTLGIVNQTPHAGKPSCPNAPRRGFGRSPGGDPLQMNPSDQMTYVLQKLSNGSQIESIVRLFGGDESLVKLLLTSLQAFGFIVKKDNTTKLTEKGKSRTERSQGLVRLGKDD